MNLLPYAFQLGDSNSSVELTNYEIEGKPVYKTTRFFTFYSQHTSKMCMWGNRSLCDLITSLLNITQIWYNILYK